MRAPGPMHATIRATIPETTRTFEQTHDGMRGIAVVTSRDSRLVTRNGRDGATRTPIRSLAKGAARLTQRIAERTCFRDG
jgi:ATP-dependent DNA ligase